MENKKKIIWLVFLILIFFLGDRTISWGLSNIVKNSKFRYSRLYEGNAEADILLLGNSRGVMLYQPYIEEVTNLKTFNLSYNSLPIDLGKVLIEDYLDLYPAPKYLLIDVTMCDRDNPELIGSFSSYSTYSDRLQKLIKKRTSESELVKSLINLYKFNNETFLRALYYTNETDERWLVNRVINQSMIKNVGLADSLKYNTTELQLENLTSVIHTAQSRGVDVKLIINPYYPPFIKKIVNFDQWVSRVEQATQMKVHNFVDAIQTTSGFADYQHVNKKGAKEYIEYLADQNIIPRTAQ